MEFREVPVIVFRLVLVYTMTSLLTLPVMSTTNQNGACTTLEFCQDVLPYNMTIFPNILNHTSQEDAIQVYYQVLPLVQTGCSDSLHLFLCFSLAPVCTVLEKFLPVCRPLCKKAVTQECLDLLQQMGIGVPQILQCERLPERGLCVSETPQSVSGPGNGNAVSPNNLPLDLYFLVRTDNKLQLLVLRSPSDMDSLTLYRRLDKNMAAALDYYLPQKYIYWASPLEGKIYRGSFIMETLREVAPIINTGSATVESLVVDWNLCVLFWSESVPVARIRTASLSGRGVKTVVEDDLTWPISLTVDPTSGLLFWIDRRGDEFNTHAKIDRFSVVTNQRRNVFTTAQGSRPQSLVADMEDKKLFWVDARSESLHSINYDGSGHRILISRHTTKFLQEPDSLVVSGDKVIWVDKVSKSLISANKHDGSSIMQIKKFDTYLPQNLRLYGKTAQINTTSYNKEQLTEDWQELSSRENLDIPEHLGNYGCDSYDDDYGDGDNGGGRGEMDKKHDKRSSAHSNGLHKSVYFVISLALLQVCYKIV